MTYDEIITEPEQFEGLYVAAFFSDDTIAKLADWLEKSGVPNPVIGPSLHTTIVYSRVPVSGFELNSHVEVVVDPAYVFLDLWNTYSGKTLVLQFFSPYLEMRFQEAMACGATYDFPEYKPHVTLSYDVGNFDISKLVKPNFPLVIVGEYSEVLLLDA